MLIEDHAVLDKSEQQFRGIFEGAPNGICVSDPDGRLIQVNAAFCRMLGYSEQELLNMAWADRTHPEDLAAGRLRKEQLWSGRVDSLEAEIRYIHRTGTSVSCRIRVALVRDSSGNPIYSVVHIEDITATKRAQEALHESETRFQIMADGCPTMLWVTDAAGESQFLNRAYGEFFATTCEQLKDGKWHSLIHRDDVSEYVEVFQRAVREHAPFLGEARARRADGEWRWLDSRAEPRFSPRGEFLGHVGLSQDITERRKAEQHLRRSEEKFRQLAENIREVFWIMDAEAREILYVSPAYEQIWGHPCASLYTNPEGWINSIHPEDRQNAEKAFRRQVHGEILENEYRIVQPSGAIRWIRDRAFPVRDSGGNIVRLAGVAEDTTERKLSELRLVHQALYDQLTGLPNRRLFSEKLEQSIAECGSAKSGAVFFIDLDRFKLVNDTLGHSAGDDLVKEVAHRLLAACPESGTLARFGGDEFMLVASGLEAPDSACRLGRKLLRCLDEPFRISDREVFIGASVGISVFPGDGTDLELLKRNADIALHEAKRAGKNQIMFFTPAFADMAREQMEIEMRLRRALEFSEFKLQFQPQFASGRPGPTRFEALIRWCPADGTLIPPSKFVPVAEQNGLIIPIGTWVLREACQRCAGWQTGSLKRVGVAVNVSALQFSRPDFVETVVRILEIAALPPHLLELEVTESVLIPDLQASASKLTELRNLGVTIALDDFGTGYSSLSYLQALPLDALKIERSFVTNNKNLPHGAAVLRCVLELAHTLGLRVIGEGVETEAQLDLLVNLGCDEMQGFLLGRPSFHVAASAGRGGISPRYPTRALPQASALAVNEPDILLASRL